MISKLMLFVMLLIVLVGCHRNTTEFIDKKGLTIEKRVLCPDGYSRNDLEEGSWGHFLQNLRLKEVGSKILDYQGNPIKDQNKHIAIIDYSIGRKDLQQCADAIIRLRSEYLFATGQYEKIKFHFTNGDLYTWIDHANGIRTVVEGNNITFVKNATKDHSYNNLKNYLEIVFMYAGTISLNEEIIKVEKNENISIGDVIIVPGSPGHAVLIVDEAVGSDGDKIFLLAEGFMPAQSIHVLTNFDDNTGPWYHVKLNDELKTSRFKFTNANIGRFE